MKTALFLILAAVELLLAAYFVGWMFQHPGQATTAAYQVLRILLILPLMLTAFLAGKSAPSFYALKLLAAYPFAALGDILLPMGKGWQEAAMLLFSVFQCLAAFSISRYSGWKGVNIKTGAAFLLFTVACLAATQFLIPAAPATKAEAPGPWTLVCVLIYVVAISVPLAAAYGYAASERWKGRSWIFFAAALGFLIGDALIAANQKRSIPGFPFWNTLFYYPPMLLYAAYPWLKSVGRIGKTKRV